MVEANQPAPTMIASGSQGTNALFGMRSTNASAVRRQVIQNKIVVAETIVS
jgi:hypothetical protein